MQWFSGKSRKNTGRKPVRSNRNKRLHSFERLESRELMAAGVVWENNVPPPGFSAKVENASLVFTGSETRDKVLVHDIVANTSHKLLTAGQKYIEIQHQDATNKLRRGWVPQNDSLSFTFFGKGGDDHFQYIDTSGDPGPHRDRRIIAYGGPGNDSLHGYKMNDVLFGDDGNDDIYGELGCDLVVGGTGNDRLWGDGVTSANRSQTADADYLEGGEGLDKLEGWQGGDLLNGGNYWKVNDGAVDELYGGSEADTFYLETFFNPNTKEARDLSPAIQGDKPDAISTPVQPPSYDEWLARYQKSLPSRPLNLDAFPNERKFLANGDGPKFWPNLGTNYEVIGPATQTYNCIAASVGEYHRDLWSVPTTLGWANTTYQSRGFSGPTAYGSAAGKKLLADANLQTVVVYGVPDAGAAYKSAGGIRITHAAQRLADGTYVSKLGDYALIRHTTAEAAGGGLYGKPLYVYSRPRTG